MHNPDDLPDSLKESLPRNEGVTWEGAEFDSITIFWDDISVTLDAVIDHAEGWIAYRKNDVIYIKYSSGAFYELSEKELKRFHNEGDHFLIDFAKSKKTA